MLNVLLGEEILPVGHNSTTSVLCEIYYTERRDEKAALIHLRNGGKRKLNLRDDDDRSLFKNYVLKGRASSKLVEGSYDGRALSKHVEDANEDEEVCFKVEVLLHLDFLQVSYIYCSCIMPHISTTS